MISLGRANPAALLIGIGTLALIRALQRLGRRLPAPFLAIGKHLAAKAGHTFDVSQQIVGEAACDLGAALFGGFASSGSFTRSAVNYEAGAVTRLSCVFSGFIVIGVMLVAAPDANHIPLAALAGTLVHVGLKLVDVSKLKQAMATICSASTPGRRGCAA